LDNAVYLQDAIEGDLEALPKETRERVLDALDNMRSNPLEGSREVAGLNLRSLTVAGIRIDFRYVPEKNAVLVANVSPEIESISGVRVL
jgi:mRNA-degrading endonuclease RelE of RelBE toxin-antitoxin system